MVAGVETLDVARGLARDAAGELAAGASYLTRAEDALIVAERMADLSSVVARSMSFAAPASAPTMRRASFCRTGSKPEMSLAACCHVRIWRDD